MTATGVKATLHFPEAILESPDLADDIAVTVANLPTPPRGAE